MIDGGIRFMTPEELIEFYVNAERGDDQEIDDRGAVAVAIPMLANSMVWLATAVAFAVGQNDDALLSDATAEAKKIWQRFGELIDDMDDILSEEDE